MLRAEITDRLLGVEIECVVPIIGRGDNIDVQNLLAEILTAHGIRAIARGYTKSPIPTGYMVAVEHDSSLRAESRYQSIRWSQIELKTLPATYRYLSEWLTTAVDILNYCGARVSGNSCGLHCHVHLPECVDHPQVVRNLQHLWWRFHQVMYGLVAPSRRTSQYCRPPRLEDATRFDKVRSYEQLCRELRRCDRYEGLNLTNLLNRERLTAEWRLHGGTTDVKKALTWILACQRWTEHAVARSCHFKEEPIANTKAGLNALLVTTGLKSNSRIYRKVAIELKQAGRFLRRRWRHFNERQEYKGKAAAA